MNLNERIMEEMKASMRAKDSLRLNVVRNLKSAVKYAAIEKLGADGELDDVGVIAVVQKEVKKRSDSAVTYRDAGRTDLAEKEESEITVLEEFLPEAISDEEVGKLADESIAEVGATSKKDMGAVMKILQQKAAGRADNKALSQAVMQRLS